MAGKGPAFDPKDPFALAPRTVNDAESKAPYSVAPASGTAGGNYVLDLDDIFAGEFFNHDLDFSAIGLTGTDAQSGCGSPTIGSVASDAFDDERNNNAPAGTATVSRQGVILVPPSIPFVGRTTMKAPNSALNGKNLRSSGGGADGYDDGDEYEYDDDYDDATHTGAGAGAGGRSKRKKVSGGTYRPAAASNTHVVQLTLTEQQKLERRERNREHAKRSRIRKKVLLDLLQDQLTALRGENKKLRHVVSTRICDHAADILSSCTTEESLLLLEDDDMSAVNDTSAETLQERKSARFKRILAFQQKHGMGGSALAAATAAAASGGSADAVEDLAVQQHSRILMEPDFRLISALSGSQSNFCISDPSLPDNPIVYCSDGFCKTTGYKRQEVLGRNCRFLQGPSTDAAAVDIIRQGVAEGRDISVCLLNYKADGTPFWNQFFVAALKDSDGAVVNYVGVQCEVNNPKVHQIKERVKRLPIDTTGIA